MQKPTCESGIMLVTAYSNDISNQNIE